MKRYYKGVCALVLAALLAVALLSPAAYGAEAKTLAGKAAFASSSDAMGVSEKSAPLTVPYSYSDAWFAEPATAYNHELARMSLLLSNTAWTASPATWERNANSPILDKTGYTRGAEYLQKLYKDLGYKPLRYCNYETPLDDESDKVAFGLAEKRLKLGDKDCVILALAIRGGNYGGEWVSNGNVGDGANHAGFEAAAAEVLRETEKIIAAYGGNLRVKVWITGYSRGGSVGNLVAAALDRAVAEGKSALQKDNLFAYNFAVPLCTKDPEAQNAIYSNIFNIINPVDVIMIAPFRAWGFGRYGVEKYLEFLEPGTAYDALDAEYTKLFAGISDATFDLHPVTWEQFRTLYLIDAIAPALMTSTAGLMPLQPGMQGLIRSFFVQGTLMPDIEAGNWQGAYEGILGEDIIWAPALGMSARLAGPLNAALGLFGVDPVDPGLLSFILCIGGRAAGSISQSGSAPSGAGIAAALPIIVRALVRWAMAAPEGEASAQGFVDNIIVAHSAESYMLLMSQPEGKAFGTGETHGLKVS